MNHLGSLYPHIWVCNGVRLSRLEGLRPLIKRKTEPLLSIDAMDTGEGYFMTCTILDHTLELQKTVSLPPGSLHGTNSPPQYLPLATARNVNDQLEIHRYQITDLTGSHICADLLQPLTFEE